MWTDNVRVEVLEIFAAAQRHGPQDVLIAWQARIQERRRWWNRNSKRKSQAKPKATTCKNGHERTPENTYQWRREKKCRPCMGAAQKKWRGTRSRTPTPQ